MCIRDSSGAYDPLPAVCDWAHAAGAWVHVDGAFGLWAAAVPALAELTVGLAGADSWATDFHKWLNTPYDSGLAIVRDADALRAAMAITADYLPTDSLIRNPSDFTPRSYWFTCRMDAIRSTIANGRREKKISIY